MNLYLVVKQVHIVSVLLSFALFLFRGGLMFANVRWRQHPVLRIAPHAVDTILLTSALFLVSLLHQYPFVHHWLTVKVVALLVYIVLGSLALKRARTLQGRLIAFVLAIVTFLFIISVARMHHPFGLIAPFLS